MFKGGMPYINNPTKAILTFLSISDLSMFKNACACNDFYVDRDALTLVGNFTEEQCKMASDAYRAVCEKEVG